MAAAERRVAFRGLVKVAKKLARRYAEAPRPATLSQSSTDAALKTFVRKLLLVVHPDKGGLQADFVELRDAQTRWVELGGGGGPGGGGEGAPPDGGGGPGAAGGGGGGGGPPPDGGGGAGAAGGGGGGEGGGGGGAGGGDDGRDGGGVALSLLPDTAPFRVNCQGLLLTYQSFRTAAVWPAFKAWVRAEAQSWRARYHGATMEFNDPARAGPGDVRHLHLMLRFREKVGFVLFQRPPGGGAAGGGSLCVVQAGARLVPRRNGRLLRKWVPPFLEPLRAGPTRAGGTDGRGGGVHLQTVKTAPPGGRVPRRHPALRGKAEESLSGPA